MSDNIPTDKKEAYSRCYNRGLHLITRREHCMAELYRKLSMADGEEAAAYALERLADAGLVDDERFAENYAAELAEVKHMGKRGIAAKIISRGVEPEIARRAAESLDLDEREGAREVVERKYLSRLDTEKGRRQVFSALMRLGYSREDIFAAIAGCREETE